MKPPTNGPPLRVLFVESNTELGGAQVALLTMLGHLDRGRISPFIACLGFGEGDLPDRVARLGVPVHRLPPGRFRSLPVTARKIARLRDLIRIQQIDVVLSNGGHALLYSRPAALLAGKPCLWWVHGCVPHDLLLGHVVPYAEQFLGADALLANSRYTAGVIERTFPEWPRPRVVACGTDLHRFRPDPAAAAAARASLGLEKDECVVGIFGRLQPGKGQHVFLQAASRVAQHGRNCRFLVVGGSVFGLSPEYGVQLRQSARDLRLNGRVLFLGQREDTNELMNACDVVVLASVEPESWGLVVSEAMAAGRPVVASAAGGPLEMIHHGDNGWLVPPGEPAALATALELLLRQPDLRAQLGAAARKHAEEHFDADRAAAVFCEELHRACIEGHGAY